MLLRSKYVAIKFLLLVTASTAYGQNNKPIRSGSWYEDRATAVASTLLTLQFAQVPSDKFTNIIRMSCRVTTYYGNQRLTKAVLAIGTAAGLSDIGRTKHFEVARFDKSVGNTTYFLYYTFNEALNFKVGPGRFPSVVFESPDNYGNSENVQPTLGAECTFVGELSDD